MAHGERLKKTLKWSNHCVSQQQKQQQQIQNTNFSEKSAKQRTRKDRRKKKHNKIQNHFITYTMSNEHMLATNKNTHDLAPERWDNIQEIIHKTRFGVFCCCCRCFFHSFDQFNIFFGNV